MAKKVTFKGRLKKGCIAILNGKPYSAKDYTLLLKAIENVVKQQKNNSVLEINPFYESFFYDNIIYGHFAGQLVDGNTGQYATIIEMMKRAKSSVTPGKSYDLSSKKGLGLYTNTIILSEKNDNYSLVSQLLGTSEKATKYDSFNGILFHPGFVGLQKWYSSGGDLSSKSNYLSAGKDIDVSVDNINGRKKLIKRSDSYIGKDMIDSGNAYRAIAMNMMSLKQFNSPSDFNGESKSIKTGEPTTLWKIYEAIGFDDEQILSAFSKYKEGNGNYLQGLDGEQIPFEETFASIGNASVAKTPSEVLNAHFSFNDFLHPIAEIDGDIVPLKLAHFKSDNSSLLNVLQAQKEAQDAAFFSQIAFDAKIGEHNKGISDALSNAQLNILNRHVAVTEVNLQKESSIKDGVRQLTKDGLSSMQSMGALLKSISDPEVSIQLPFLSKNAISITTSHFNKGINFRMKGGRYVQNPGDFIDFFQLVKDIPIADGVIKKKGSRLSLKEKGALILSGKATELDFETKVGLNHIQLFNAAGENLEDLLSKGDKVDLGMVSKIGSAEVAIRFDFHKDFGFSDVASSKNYFGNVEVADMTTFNLIGEDGAVTPVNYTDLGETAEERKESFSKLLLTGEVQFASKEVNFAFLKSFPQTKTEDIEQDVATRLFDMIKYFEKFINKTNTLGARVPASKTSSGFPAKIVKFINSHSNTVWVSSKKNALDGSDYDIDELTMYFFEDREETSVMPSQEQMANMNSKQLNELVSKLDNQDKNAMLDAMLAYYKDAKNIPIFFAPVTTENLDFLIDQFDKAYGDLGLNTDKLNTRISNVEYSPQSQIQGFQQNFSGKDTVGIFANSIKVHTHVYATYLSQKGKHFQFEFNGKTYTNFSEKSTDVSNEYIIDFLGELLQSALDNAKMLTLARIFVNPKTAGTVSAMAMAGIPKTEIIDMLLSDSFQSIFEEVIDSGSIANFNTLAKNPETVVNNHEAIYNVVSDLFNNYDQIPDIFNRAEKQSLLIHDLVKGGFSYKNESGDTERGLLDREFIDVSSKVKLRDGSVVSLTLTPEQFKNTDWYKNLQSSMDKAGFAKFEEEVINKNLIYNKKSGFGFEFINPEAFQRVIANNKSLMGDYKNVIYAGAQVSTTARILSINQGLKTSLFEINRYLDDYEFATGKDFKFKDDRKVIPEFYGVPVTDFINDTRSINPVEFKDKYYRISEKEIDRQTKGFEFIDIDRVVNSNSNIRSYIQMAEKMREIYGQTFAIANPQIQTLVANKLASMRIDRIYTEDQFDEVMKNYYNGIVNLFLQEAFNPLERGEEETTFTFGKTLRPGFLTGNTAVHTAIDQNEFKVKFIGLILDLKNNPDSFGPGIKTQLENNKFWQQLDVVPTTSGINELILKNSKTIDIGLRMEMENGIRALNKIFKVERKNGLVEDVDFQKMLFMYQLIKNSLAFGKNDYSEYIDTKYLHDFSHFMDSFTDKIIAGNEYYLDLFQSHSIDHLGLGEIAPFKNSKKDKAHDEYQIVGVSGDKLIPSEGIKTNPITGDTTYSNEDWVRPRKAIDNPNITDEEIISSYPSYVRMRLLDKKGEQQTYNMKLVKDDVHGWVYKKAINRYYRAINSNFSIEQSEIVDKLSYKFFTPESLASFYQTGEHTINLKGKLSYPSGTYYLPAGKIATGNMLYGNKFHLSLLDSDQEGNDVFTGLTQDQQSTVNNKLRTQTFKSMFAAVFPTVSIDTIENDGDFNLMVQNVEPALKSKKASELNRINAFVTQDGVVMRGSWAGYGDKYFHEFGHIIGLMLNKSEGGLWAKVSDEIKNTKTYSTIANSNEYKGLSEERLIMETFAHLMEAWGGTNSLFNPILRTATVEVNKEKNRFTRIFGDIFKWIKDLFSNAFSISEEGRLIVDKELDLNKVSWGNVMAYFVDGIKSGKLTGKGGVSLTENLNLKKLFEKSNTEFSIHPGIPFTNMDQVKEYFTGYNIASTEDNNASGYANKLMNELPVKGKDKSGKYKHFSGGKTYEITEDELKDKTHMEGLVKTIFSDLRVYDDNLNDNVVNFLSGDKGMFDKQPLKQDFLNQEIGINTGDSIMRLNDFLQMPEFKGLIDKSLFNSSFNPVVIVSESKELGHKSVRIFDFTTYPVQKIIGATKESISPHFIGQGLFNAERFRLNNNNLGLRKLDLITLSGLLNTKINVTDTAIVDMRWNKTDTPVFHGIELPHYMREIKELFGNENVNRFLPPAVRDSFNAGDFDSKKFNTNFFKELLYMYSDANDTGLGAQQKTMYENLYGYYKKGDFTSNKLVELINSRMLEITHLYNGELNKIENDQEYQLLSQNKYLITSNHKRNIDPYGDLSKVSKQFISQSNMHNPILGWFISRMQKKMDKIANTFKAEWMKPFQSVLTRFEKEKNINPLLDLTTDQTRARFKNMFVTQKVTRDDGTVVDANLYEIYYKYTDEKGQVHQHANVANSNLSETELEMGGLVVKNLKKILIEKHVMKLNEKVGNKLNATELNKLAEEWYEQNWKDGRLPIMESRVTEKIFTKNWKKGLTQWFSRYTNSNEIFDFIKSDNSNFNEINDIIYYQAHNSTTKFGSEFRQQKVGVYFDEKLNQDRFLTKKTLGKDGSEVLVSYGEQINNSGELNLELIMSYTMMNHISKKEFEDLMPDYYAAQTILSNYEHSKDTAFENSKSYLTDLVKFIVKGERQMLNSKEYFSVDGKSTIGASIDNVVNNVSTASVFAMMGGNIMIPITNVVANAANTLSFVLGEKLTNVLAPSDAKKSNWFGAKDLMKASKFAASNFNLFIKIIDEYRIVDGDMKEIINSPRFQKTKKLFGSYHMYWLNFAGDYMFRGLSFVAQMMKDGALDAHSLDENGELVYNEELDKRWDGSEDSNLIKDEIKKQLQEEGIESVDGKLTRAYDNNLKRSSKAIADRFIAGTYSSSEKRLLEMGWLGKMFAMFHRYFFDKVDQMWSKSHISSTFGNYETQEITNPDGTVQKVAQWKGRLIEGKVQSIMNLITEAKKMTDSGFPAFKQAWDKADPMTRKNMIKIVQDFALVTCVSLLSAGLGAPEDDKKKKKDESFWQALWHKNTSNRFMRSLDYGFYDIIADMSPSEYARMAASPFVVFTQMKKFVDLVGSGFGMKEVKNTFGIVQTVTSVGDLFSSGVKELDNTVGEARKKH